MQRRVERDKYKAVNVERILIRQGPQNPIHLTIVQEPHSGRDGITQNRPRPWCQRVVRLKRATFIFVIMDSVSYFPTTPFSPSMKVIH